MKDQKEMLKDITELHLSKNLMKITVYIAEYLLSGALATMSLYTTLSNSGIQEHI